MPELPEVETVKNDLIPLVVGREVTGVNLLWEGIVRKTTAGDFITGLTGRMIKGIKRRGKYLIFGLDGSETLIAHLKMSGALIAGNCDITKEKYARAVLHLNDGTCVIFRDPRKFGRMWLVKDSNSVIGGLGPEPLEDDFTPELLAQRLKGKKAPIKAVICDQKVIAGVGNLYADEALYLAGIHPLTPAGSLSPAKNKDLFDAIQAVLRKGIKNRGASIENYVRPDGNKGTAHLEFLVPRKSGQPCGECAGKVERITVRGRGTYFCPKCQT
jgi:formamidopyrimidine-DNA glycosylase